MDRQLVYIILAVAVLFFIGMMVKDWRSSSNKKNDPVTPPVSPKNGLAITLPLCLQAYERLVVFLERIRPEVLVRRLEQQSQLSVQETRHLLIQSIRSEFEHNVSQQIYVTDAAWEAIASAKEQMIRLINVTAADLSLEGDGRQLLKALLKLSAQQKESPLATALNVLNSESKKLLTTAKSS